MSTAQQEDDRERPATERWTELAISPWLLKVGLLLFGLGLIVFLELAFQAARYGGSADLFIPRTTWTGEKVFTRNFRAAHRYHNYDFNLSRYLHPVGAQATWGMETQEEFKSEKTPGTLRVLLIGSSSVRGFPLGKAFSFGKIFEIMLQKSAPKHVIEVINPAIDAMSSTMVRQMFEESLLCNPDMVVFYLGHNEFYGVGGAASTKLPGLDGWPGKIFSFIQHLKLYRLLQKGYRKMADKVPFSGGSEPGEDRNLLKKMVDLDNVLPEGSRTGEAVARFRKNLASTVEQALEQKVNVVLMTVDSRLRDMPPLRSQPLSELPDSQRERVEGLIDDGRRLYESGHLEGAEETFREACRAAPAAADVHFLLGQTLLEANRVSEGKKELRLSRDLDRMPFRASSKIDSSIRSVAESFANDEKFNFVDIEHLFTELARDGVAGRDIFLEHVHFTFHGRYIMALALQDTVMKSTLRERFTMVPELIPREREFYEQTLGFGVLEKMFESGYALNIFEKYPFEGRPDIERIRDREELLFRSLQARLNAVEKNIYDGMDRKLTKFSDIRWFTLVGIGLMWNDWGVPDNALTAWRKLIREFPRLWIPYNLIGRIHMAGNRPAKAIDLLKQAIFLHDQYGWDDTVFEGHPRRILFAMEESCFEIARGLAMMGERDSALSWLKEADRRGFNRWQVAVTGMIGRFISTSEQELRGLVKQASFP